jgi:Flp pilus assembly CpaF family ATPase
MIRKHQNVDENLNLKKLLEYEMLTEMEASFLISEIENGKNVIFSGKGNSGKTTLLRALVNQLSREKRVQVMEESAELKLVKANVIAYLVRRGSRGKTIGMDELINLGLVSSVDIFIFGETRGEEALALYDASFSGHQVLTTLHTSDPNEVPERLLINMKKSGTDIPSEILMSMLQKSIDYIVQMKNLKVESISRVSKDGISIINI